MNDIKRKIHQLVKPESTNNYDMAHQGMRVLEMSCGEFCMLCVEPSSWKVLMVATSFWKMNEKPP